MARPAAERWPVDDDVVTGSTFSLRVLLLTLVVLIMLAATIVIALARYVPSVRSKLPWSRPAACSTERVAVVVAPELLGAVQQIMKPVQGKDLEGGHCLSVQVRGQDAADVIAGASVLPRDRWPAIWIPDSSLWLAQPMPFATSSATRFASSPLVIATNRAGQQRLGWTTHPPTWAQALTGPQPVTIPQLTSGTTGLAAVLALRASLRDGPQADSAVAAAVLAANRTSVNTVSAAIQRIAAGDATAPVTPLSEQEVVIANAAAGSPKTVAVYPSDGSPSLDYPVLRVSADRFSPGLRRAVDEAVAAFDDPDVGEIVGKAGFRNIDGNPPAGTGISTGEITVLDLPDTVEVQSFIAKLTALAQPGRLLVVVDVSTSMKDAAAAGLSRIELAAASAVRAGDLLPNRSSVGLWIFATKLQGAAGWRSLEPTIALDAPERNGTHKQAVQIALRSLPGRLSPGGTALYDTALAAVRDARRQYDPAAANSVVLFTDGKNDEPGGISLTTLVAQLKADAAKQPGKKVRLITIGLGQGVDIAALTAMSQAAGGQAYRAQTAEEMKQVLFAAMNTR